MKYGITFVKGQPKLCISVATAYTYVVKKNKIKLVNVVYIPSLKKYGVNYNIDVPHRMKKMFNNIDFDLDSCDLLEDFGIHEASILLNRLNNKDKSVKTRNVSSKEYLHSDNKKSDIESKKYVRRYTTIKRY